jgi:nucleoside-diphosphate-sugar epimerase
VRVLVTGHNGYIGSVLVPMLLDAGHHVVGLDSYLFEECNLGEGMPSVPAIRMDVRDVGVSDLAGFEAIVHLAGISNDPLGNLNPECTYAINHRASVRLAQLAKEAGVSRFLFSSSCSLYGSAGDEIVAEEASFKPVTPYGRSKVLVEHDLAAQASPDFSPTFLRNGTAYGWSPRLRADLVVNNLLGFAYTTGRVLIKSDGRAWRPLVHVQDIANAFRVILEAPRDLVHNEAFNVGSTKENYLVAEVAQIVAEVVGGSGVVFAKDGESDPRCYRVDCGKLSRTLPAFQPRWTVRDGAEELLESYRRHQLTFEAFAKKFHRIEYVKELIQARRLDRELRWCLGDILSPIGSPNA